MTIGARTAAWSGAALPYDAEVEYIGSSGTQWVDTGILKDGGLEIEARATLTSSVTTTTNDGCALFGDWTEDWSENAYGFTFKNFSSAYATQFLLGYANYSHWMNYSKEVVGVSIDIEYGKGVCKIDGDLVVSKPEVSFSTSDHITIFGFNHNGMNLSSWKLNFLKMYKDGVVLRDYIPVRVGSVGYMYDRVSRKLFGNAGTGAFTWGELA